MKRVFFVAIACIAGCSTPTMFTNGGADIPAEKGKTHSWNLDGDAAGSLPSDFILVLGKWAVAAEPSAPSQANVLRQSGNFNNPDFPRVIVKDLTFTDTKVTVHCRPESGSTDEACGLIFRAVDSDNYYVTRANALENSVNLYHSIHGDRSQFAGADLPVTAGAWHTLEADTKGRSITILWDGRQVVQASDGTFAKGKIGLWTKSDSVTAFDDLQATEQ